MNTTPTNKSSMIKRLLFALDIIIFLIAGVALIYTLNSKPMHANLLYISFGLVMLSCLIRSVVYLTKRNRN